MSDDSAATTPAAPPTEEDGQTTTAVQPEPGSDGSGPTLFEVDDFVTYAGLRCIVRLRRIEYDLAVVNDGTSIRSVPIWLITK